MNSGKLIELYNILPFNLQNFVLDIYGIKVRYNQFLWEKYIKKFACTEYMIKEKQIAYVERKLRFILMHAIMTVPRYKSYKTLLREIKDSKSNIFRILTKFPIIRKQDIINNYEMFLSERPLTDKIVVAKTSGTTGTPFKVFMDKSTFNIANAMWWRRTLWAGYKKNDWIARLVGDPIVPLDVKNPKIPWRISFISKRVYLSSYHLNKETAIKYLDILEKLKPNFLMGYPSALSILCTYAIENNVVPRWKPKAIFFSSEPMYEHQREIISKVLAAPLRGLYGSAERAISAAQCEHETYHLSLVDGFLEGQFGILPARQPALVTSLLNTVMPLIRFELGDIVEPMPEISCKCGRTLPAIKPVVTKKEDYIITPSGRRISSSVLTWAFKDLIGIRRSQIVQFDLDKVKVLIDSDKEVFERYQFLLKQRLNKMMFGEMKIFIEFSKDFSVTNTGKTRFVVRNFKDREF